jgi:hypothetical protein
MALIAIGVVPNKREYAYCICIGYLFCGIQPIVSTCMAMTKSDVRKYTQDLITLSYVRKASATSYLKQPGTYDDNDNERE